MGVHTWFYRKVNRTEEEAKYLAIVELYKKIEMCNRYITSVFLKTNSPDEPGGYNFTAAKNLESTIWEIKLYEKTIRLIEKRIAKTLHWYYQPESLNEYIPSMGFFVEDKTMPHNIFRGPDVEEMLFSLPETMRFCIKYNIVLTDEQKFKLQKFWFEYNDGMICFG